MNSSWYRALAASLLVLTTQAGFSAEHRQRTYELIDLGTLPGATGSTASGINNLGEVTGESNANVFVFSHGRIAPLTAPELTLRNSSSAAINDVGQVLGSGCCVPGPLSFLYDYRNHSISVLPLPFTFEFFALNDRGQITGQGSSSSEEDRAFVYDPKAGEFTTIDSLADIDSGQFNSGHGINAEGDVTGVSHTNTGTDGHAFLYRQGTVTDLGTLGGDNSTGNSINRFDQVTGYSNTKSGSIHAFLYERGEMIDIGSLGGDDSEGLSINDPGEVVGDSNEAGNGTVRHAFLYRHHRLVDLNQLINQRSSLAHHVTLNSAVGINNLGEIAANGSDSSTGQSHAYLLKPVRRDRDDHGRHGQNPGRDEERQYTH
ncbi:MAG TPA: hypothetical protein VGM84_12965 [Steroidobacteraceae bacterium]